MPTYALLGATGATGTSILRSLLSQPPKDLTLKIYIRSLSKLLRIFPNLQTSPPFPITIIEGAISDKAALQSCLEGADVIFICIATNESTPGTSVSYDVADAVVQALRANREGKGKAYVTPTLLQLRAVPVNEDMQHTSGIMVSVVRFALYHVYADLTHASALLYSAAKESPGLFNYIFVDPPALHDADGTECTGYRIATAEQAAADSGPGEVLSYADLGAAFCEIAVRKEEFLGKGLLVWGTGEVKMTWGVNFGFLVRGIKGRVFG